MIRTKYVLILMLLLTLFAAGCQAAGQEPAFTAEDKAEIVRLTLERALVDQEIPDYGLLIESGEPIILSTDNIEDVALPDLPGHSIILMTAAEIRAKANAEGDFLYTRFEPFEVERPDKVNLGFGSQWAVAEDSTSGYLSGGGLQMVYEREADGWIGEVEAVWIS
jgi:hypothetical protein